MEFREQVYSNVIKAKEGTYIISKIFSADYHLQGIEMLKEMVRFKIFADNGFDITFSDDWQRLRKINLEFNKKVSVKLKGK